MFDSKKWLVLLIPLSILIWGYITWQVIDGLDPELPPIEKVDQSRFRESVTKNKKVTALKEPEFDPFLGFRYKKKQVTKTVKAKPVKKDSLIWPAIKYIGFIKDKNSSRKVVAIQINGAMRTFNKNQMIDSITLVNATTDYARLKYKNEQKKVEK
jgi:hypothetical protein